MEMLFTHNNFADILVLERFLGKPIILLFHPVLIKYVMVDNHKNYAKGKVLRRFAAAIGEGLFISEGEKWRRDRQTIQPMFSRKHIEEMYFGFSNNSSERCKQRWLEKTKNGPAEINLAQEMYVITADVIISAVFGEDIDKGIIDVIYDRYVYIMEYLRQPRPAIIDKIKKAVRHPGYVRFQSDRDDIAKVIKGLIEDSRSRPASARQGMVRLLLQAQEEDPKNFDDDELVDQIITMIFAGFESTALNLAFALFRLEEEPAVLKRLRAEIDEHAPGAKDADSSELTYDQISKLTYLKGAIHEANRLYPPFWGVARRPLGDDVIGGLPVPKDALIVMSQFEMSQRPAYWDDPNAFKPERHFIEDDKPAIMHPGVMFPFSQGPRKCVAAAFAEMEMLTVLSKLLASFDVKCLNRVNNPFDFGITLRLKEPPRAEISRRAH